MTNNLRKAKHSEMLGLGGIGVLPKSVLLILFYQLRKITLD